MPTKATTWGLGAAAATMLPAGPAAALALEAFFALPPTFVAAAEGDVSYDSGFDNLQAYALAPGDLEIFLADFDGLQSGVGSPLFGSSAFEADFFCQIATGEFNVFYVDADESIIRVLFETTLDEGDQVGDHLGLVIGFDLGDRLDDLLDGGFALATLRLNTGSAPRDPDSPVIPLPAPPALLGIAALGAVVWRRHPAT